MNDVRIVTYDQSARKWKYQPSRGPAVEFPPGKEGKKQAFTMKLRTEVPKVHQLIQHMERQQSDSQIKRRAFDGAVLLSDNLIISKADSDLKTVVARAATSRRTVEYIISQGVKIHSLYSCTCPDWRNGEQLHILDQLSPDRPAHGAPHIPQVGVMCKHTWAYHLGATTQRIKSLENPHGQELASRLWKLIVEAIQHIQDYEPMINEGTPITMTRGMFVLALPDELAAVFAEHPDLITNLNTILAQATNESQTLKIV